MPYTITNNTTIPVLLDTWAKRPSNYTYCIEPGATINAEVDDNGHLIFDYIPAEFESRNSDDGVFPELYRDGVTSLLDKGLTITGKISKEEQQKMESLFSIQGEEIRKRKEHEKQKKEILLRKRLFISRLEFKKEDLDKAYQMNDGLVKEEVIHVGCTKLTFHRILNIVLKKKNREESEVTHEIIKYGAADTTTGMSVQVVIRAALPKYLEMIRNPDILEDYIDEHIDNVFII